LEPPIWPTLPSRSLKPPRAAKNGTCVVPACVTSGPVPETAALRMGSSWTSQPTTCTLTLMPVCAVKGASSWLRSFLGSGLLGIVHIVSVTFCLAAVDAVLLPALLSELSEPPQAASPNAPTAIADRTIAILLRRPGPCQGRRARRPARRALRALLNQVAGGIPLAGACGCASV
jgi:hypothetical protein